MKPFRHKHVSDTMISDARQKVAEDRRKVDHWRTERSTHLVQVGLLDHKVALWEGVVEQVALRWWCF